MFTQINLTFKQETFVPGKGLTMVCLVLLFAVGQFTIAIAGEPISDTKAERINPEIEWDTTLRHFQFDSEKFLGQRLTLKCPPAPSGQPVDGLFGTDVYPSESSICVAALHAGKITKDGGIVTVLLMPGPESYKGSDRGGIASADLPKTRRSIQFIDENDPVDSKALAHIPRIKWDAKFTATGFANRKLVGQRFTFRCPAAPVDRMARIVFGTDRYEFASRIGPAALHAGVITKDGGLVTVQIDGPVERFTGSIRNGVETKSRGASSCSISFVKPEPKSDLDSVAKK